jgi:hypothetical protein
MYKEVENILGESVTDAMKKAWTKKFGVGKCARVKVVDGEKTKVCFLRPPSRTEMGAYSVAYRSNPVKANEYLAKQIWLAGDPEMLTSDRLFYAVAEKLPELVESAEAELDMF